MLSSVEETLKCTNIVFETIIGKKHNFEVVEKRGTKLEVEEMK